MTMKKKILTTLSVVLILGMAALGILAYLSDTDSDVNVMTLGNVDIEQTEDFVQGAPLDPSVTVKKEVTVKNVGESDAYVRTWFAFENPIDKISADGVNMSGNPVIAKINGTEYSIFVVTHEAPVAAGEFAPATLTSVTMAADATNDDVARYGDTYEVLVFTQAVQVAGFEGQGATAALNAAFGSDQPWGDTVEMPVAVATADELSAALTAGEDVYLTEDVTVTSTMDVAAGKDVKLNLNGNDLSYAVSNSGASAIINNKGSLEIEGKGIISFTAANPDLGAIPTYATNTITNTGRLVIGEGVTVTNGSEGGASYAVDNHGEFVLNGGTLIGDRCALRVAKYNQDNVKFVMNSGVIEAKTPAWIQLPGSDSKVAPKISVTINGGTMESTKDTSFENDVMYTYSYGNSHANTSITINGGEFLGGVVSIGSGYKGDAPTLNINGGIFEYDVMQWLENDGSKVLYEANK